MSETKLAAVGHNDPVCINYIDFLSASCKKRWSFVDAIYGVIPFFGIITRKTAAAPRAAPECLKDLALQIISTQVSDEINIVRLITLAQQQQIARFEILLPYPLSESQLTTVRQEYARPLELQQQDDRLHIAIPPLSH
ncbi:hypothetical protein IBT47_02210 [Erwinia sp. S43]|uniref:Uncharacterized protein n=1 Tax=Pantoea coffeiphila TaxID=1465635 RepID=A0A2S9I6T0_9GAMM|nr:hypothetical protein [Pantoea coffeiphila]MBK0031085.1 hypothetical protein [Erwinia sp. S43]PRD13476.1 hypothetical protein CQW29_20855 [Pantoea coffeiphila]